MFTALTIPPQSPRFIHKLTVEKNIALELEEYR
jgi:hypothetical protein